MADAQDTPNPDESIKPKAKSANPKDKPADSIAAGATTLGDLLPVA